MSIRAMITRIAALAAAFAVAGCAGAGADAPSGTAPSVARGAVDYSPSPYVESTHPEWARDAVLYQINTRQFTKEGTFAAAQKELPRLKALGVDILWMMPIHPIGEKNRKGSLGSPYSVKDYRGVNPEFGTIEDFKAFVDAAHAEGFHVILDWVANHTAWDNPLVNEHPEWYETDWKGDYRPTPWWDWSDIIDLDFSKPKLREYMAGAMKYWVEEIGVDGFRCDVAAYVPVDFWEDVSAELNAVKPVFMLAEAHSRDLHRRAFNASYAWAWNNAMHDITMGKANTGALYGYYSENESAWPVEAMRMTYTENHDQNAWEGTTFERFGKGAEAAIALSFLGEGIPLIHNGQEAGNEKRLEFFEKDAIRWRKHKFEDLFVKLIGFRDAHPALHNMPWGARMVAVANSNPQQVFSYQRKKNADEVFVVINFSGKRQTVSFPETQAHGSYTDIDGRPATIDAASKMTIEPWGWRAMAK